MGIGEALHLLNGTGPRAASVRKDEKNKKYRPKAGQIFWQIGQNMIESKKIALDVFGRRINSKRGPGVAVKTTASKLAVLF
jgi:hypothetical protein